MSHPQPKRPSAAELIKLHSKARVIARVEVHPVITKATGRRSISNEDARAQVSAAR